MPRNRNVKVTFEIELDYKKKSVTYTVRAEVSPFIPGRVSGPPENCYPPEGGEVEVKEVWFVEEKRCDKFYFSQSNKDHHPHTCKCGGRERVTVESRRPELDDLVSDKEVLNHLPDEPDEPDYDRDEG